MTQSILELVFKTSKQGQGGKAAAAELKELKGTVGEVTSGFLGMNLGTMTAVGALTAAGAAASKAVTDYQAYAEGVRGLASITGTGTEQTSRMVQAFDDLGISQEKVTSVMETAARKGFVATIDNVAKLADQYVSLSTQEDRNALLTKELGKGGLELSKAFEQGGDAIRRAADAQEAGMIITAQDAGEAEKLRVAQDNLDDSVKAVSNSFAKVLVPVLTDLINSSIHVTLTSENMSTELAKIPPQQRAGAIAAMEHREALEKLRLEEEKHGLEIIKFNDGNDVGTKKLDIIQHAAFGAAIGWAAIPTAIQQYQLAQDALNPLTAADKLAIVNEKIGLVNESFGELTKQMVFNHAAEGLNADQTEALALKMGLLDQETFDALTKVDLMNKQFQSGKIDAMGYYNAVDGIRSAFDSLNNKEVTLTVNIRENGGTASESINGGRTMTNTRLGGSTRSGPSGGGTGRANGEESFVVPPGWPNDSYKIGLSSGEQVSVVNDRMRWTGEGGGNSGPIVQFLGDIHINNGMDMATFEAKLVDVLRRRT